MSIKAVAGNRRLYFLIWALLFLAFFIRTAPRLWNDLHREKIPTPSPMSSMDHRLEPVLNLAEPSATLIQTFAQLPADCALVVVCPTGEHPWKFIRCAIGYLTWPRKIDIVRLGPNETFSGSVSERTAVLFCGLPAPLMPNAERTTMGPQLVLFSPVKIK
jgi:hypothetical protein